MSTQDPKKRMKEIEKEFVKLGIIDIPGSILVGLGLYGKFVADGDAFLPFLNNPNNVNNMLIVGGAIMLWGAYKAIKLIQERAKLGNEFNA